MSESGFASLGPTLLARKGGAKPAMRPQLAPLVQDEQELAAVAEEQLEDLGWNDMGDSEPAGCADIVPINADVAADHLLQGPGPIVRRQQRRLEERVLADAAMTGPNDAEPEDDADDDAHYSAHYEAEDYAADGYAAEDDYAEDDYAEDDYGAADSAEQATYAPLATTPARTRRKVQAIAAQPAAVPAPRVMPRAPVVQASRRAAFTLRLDADRHLKLRLAATMQGVSAQALLTEALDAMLAEFDDLDVIANHLKRH